MNVTEGTTCLRIPLCTPGRSLWVILQQGPSDWAMGPGAFGSTGPNTIGLFYFCLRSRRGTILCHSASPLPSAYPNLTLAPSTLTCPSGPALASSLLSVPWIPGSWTSPAPDYPESIPYAGERWGDGLRGWA